MATALTIEDEKAKPLRRGICVVLKLFLARKQ